MEIDDLMIGEFVFWDSYYCFVWCVWYNCCYVWIDVEYIFFVMVCVMIYDCDVELFEGMIFNCVQCGIDWYECIDDDGNGLGEELVGYGVVCMKFCFNQVVEGCVNLVGILVLYFGMIVEIVIFEVCFWIGVLLLVV